MNSFLESLLEGISKPKNYFFFTHPFYSRQEKFYSFSDLEERVLDFSQVFLIKSETCELFEVIDNEIIKLKAKIYETLYSHSG